MYPLLIISSRSTKQIIEIYNVPEAAWVEKSSYYVASGSSVRDPRLHRSHSTSASIFFSFQIEHEANDNGRLFLSFRPGDSSRRSSGIPWMGDAISSDVFRDYTAGKTP